MRGELIGVWPETWREIWAKLAKGSRYSDDLFADLYRELVPEPQAPEAPPPPAELTEEGELLRAQYPTIIPGYHLNKRHWITATIDDRLPTDLLTGLVDDSYDLVVASLTKAKREALSAL